MSSARCCILTVKYSNVDQVKWSQSYCVLHRDRLHSIDGMYTGFHAGQISWLTRDQCRMQGRVLDMQIWWRLTSFAVGDGTVVCQIWHEPLGNLFPHCKIGLTFFGELHQLGYWWHCMSSLSLMILHISFLVFCCTSASAFTRNKVTINMALTCIFYMWWHT